MDSFMRLTLRESGKMLVMMMFPMTSDSVDHDDA